MQLADNRALYEYLASLAAHLRRHGADELADAVTGAHKQAAGLSTEFLGEVRLALRRVRDSNIVDLSAKDQTDLTEVLEQLDFALDGKR